MWMVMRHSRYNLYEEESNPLSFHQILPDIFSKKFLLPIQKILYFQKLFLLQYTRKSIMQN